MNQQAARRTQAQRRSEAEEALLAAAARLFARQGIDRTSLAQVGEAAGYSRGLVNHHFGSKSHLEERLVGHTQRDFVSSLPDPTHAGPETLVALARAYVTAVLSDAEEARAFFVMWGAALPEDAGLREVVAAGDARFRFGVESLIRIGQIDGAIDAHVDPVAAAVVLVGTLRGMVAQYLVNPSDVDLESATRMCERFVRAALRPEEDQAQEGES